MKKGRTRLMAVLYSTSIQWYVQDLNRAVHASITFKIYMACVRFLLRRLFMRSTSGCKVRLVYRRNLEGNNNCGVMCAFTCQNRMRAVNER